MRVTTINVAYSRTFNLGDYNSAKFECALSAEMEEDEDEAAALAALWEVAKATVKAQALPVVRKRNDEVEAIRASVPELAQGS